MPVEVWANTPLVVWATPEPAALMPIQPLFWKRVNGPPATATWPSMMPLLTMVGPTAVAPVASAKAPLVARQECPC